MEMLLKILVLKPKTPCSRTELSLELSTNPLFVEVLPASSAHSVPTPKLVSNLWQHESAIQETLPGSFFMLNQMFDWKMKF